ncbi:hypothetical protein [Streptomyces sp. NPDC015125]|uniref:hypothetical protein n=1 Tax=Streptomyces sp. NPDC015125 TaxID=3364938 RepID=UPI0036F7D718
MTSRPIQRAPGSATATTTTAAPAEATPTAPAAPTDPTDPATLDALARRLVAPLSRLLRAELRGDRERIGRLRDHGR